MSGMTTTTENPKPLSQVHLFADGQEEDSAGRDSERMDGYCQIYGHNSSVCTDVGQTRNASEA
jgi:hypothetical protein